MKKLLKQISSDPFLESQWLNTLSLLEHIGARKIGKTVAQSHPSLEVLEHYADETRHAYAFKRLSINLSDTGHTQYLCCDAAVEYFQNLDRRVKVWLNETLLPADHYPNYLLTTSLIERRAMQLYPLYRDVTAQDCVRGELDRIIQEEAGHRKGIDRQIRNHLAEAGYQLEDCWLIEERLFSDFSAALESRLSERAVPPKPYRPGPDLKISVE